MLFPHRIVWGISGASLIVMASLLTLAAAGIRRTVLWNAISGSRIAKCATGLDSAILPKRPDSGPEEAFGQLSLDVGMHDRHRSAGLRRRCCRAYIFEGDGRSWRQVAELDTPPEGDKLVGSEVRFLRCLGGRCRSDDRRRRAWDCRSAWAGLRLRGREERMAGGCRSSVALTTDLATISVLPLPSMAGRLLSVLR